MDRRGVSAVLAADSEVEIGVRGPAVLGRAAYERADAVDVERLERGDGEDALLEVGAEEGRLDVVTGEAPRHLGEVVGAEGEELRRPGDLAGGHGRARQLDHGADLVRDGRAELLLHVAGDLLDPGPHQVELADARDERDHDLRLGVPAAPDALGSRLEDGPGLHREQAGDHDPESHAAQAEHRVRLVQALDGLQQLALALYGARARRPRPSPPTGR